MSKLVQNGLEGDILGKSSGGYTCKLDHGLAAHTNVDRQTITFARVSIPRAMALAQIADRQHTLYVCRPDILGIVRVGKEHN